jgi:hypothetical protein
MLLVRNSKNNNNKFGYLLQCLLSVLSELKESLWKDESDSVDADLCDSLLLSDRG